MIKKYNDWLSEAADPAVVVEKTTVQFEAWAKSLNLDYRISEGWREEITYYVNIPYMGSWSLIFEEGKKNTGRQDSMYRPEYQNSGKNKWYIKFPVSWSQYSPRNGYVSGNFKSFKAIIEKMLSYSSYFERIYSFFEILNIEKEWIDKKFKASYSGKNLKTLYITLPLLSGDITFPDEERKHFEIRYQPEKLESEKKTWERKSFEINNGELYYYTFLGCKSKLKLENLDLIEEILETLKDEPVEKVWEKIKTGDWEKIAHDNRGKMNSKKFGL
jgi:hypothetical protein